MTTVAGTDFVFNGDGKAARSVAIGQVFGVGAGADGQIYIASPTHNLVFRVTATGTLQTLAGNGIKGFSGEGEAATAAAFNFPTGVAVAPDGTLYIADFENHRVRKVRRDGHVETVAGDIRAVEIGDGGPALLASVYLPTAVALDGAGRLYIADNGNHRIRRVEADGTIATIAGNGNPGNSGDGGQAREAELSSPQGVALDGKGNVYFTDTFAHVVRRIGTDGVITTVAGRGVAGFGGDGGLGTAALLNEPKGLAIDGEGRIYVADSLNHRLRRIGTDGVITTVAGTGIGRFSGDGGPAAAAALNEVSGVAVASDGSVFVADLGNARVRKITTDGRIDTVAGNGNSRYSGDGGAAVAAALDSPQGIGMGVDGAFYLTDSVNNRVRMVAADGTIRTIAGTGASGFGGDGGPAVEAELRHPQGTVVRGNDGSIYFSDRKNNRIRKITADGTIQTVAGNGAAGFAGDGGPAVAAALNFPTDVELDADGSLYIADSGNHRIRRVRSDGVIETVAGTGEQGFSGDGGPAREARLRQPTGLAADGKGNLFICDFGNARVRRMGRDGVIVTVAGNGEGVYQGDGIGTEVGINGPYDAAMDTEGRLLVADLYGGRVRRLNENGRLVTIAGNGDGRYGGDGADPLQASLFFPLGMAVRPTGELLIADAGNDRIRAILATPPQVSLSRNQLQLAARSNGDPAAETLVATSTVPGVRFATRAETVTGGGWLQVDTPWRFLTQTLRVTADPRGLEAGEYQGQIVLETPGAEPAEERIAVTFTVTAGGGTALEVAPQELVFSFAEGQAGEQLVLLRNHGPEALPYKVRVEGTGTENWILADAPSGVVNPGEPQPILLRANSSRLGRGEYTAYVRVEDERSAQTAVLPVRLVVTAAQPKLVLSQTGLSFQAMEGPEAADFPQKVGVLNSGSGSMAWTAAKVEDAGPVRWLTLGGASGTAEAEGQTVPEFSAVVAAGGLATGEYRARIRVEAAGAANGTQIIDVVLNVIPRTATPRPLVTRTGLISVARQGAAAPASVSTGILNLQQRKLEFRSIRGTFDGGNWFLHRPSDGSLETFESVGITIQPDPAGLTSGLYEGVVTLMFLGQDPRNVKLILLVTPPASERKLAGGRAAAAACEPSRLAMVFTQLAPGFVVKAGQPVPLEVQATNDCGAPLLAGAAMATIDDGGAPVPLVALRDGRWAGTWVPPSDMGDRPVTVRVVAATGSGEGRRLQSTVSVSGRTGSDIQR